MRALGLVHEIKRTAPYEWYYRGCVIKRRHVTSPRPSDDEFGWRHSVHGCGVGSSINAIKSQIDERMDGDGQPL